MKENKKSLIKNMVFILCLILFSLNFNANYNGLNKILVDNNPYYTYGIENNNILYQGPVRENESLNHFRETGQLILNKNNYEISQQNKITVFTMQIYQIKLLETIFNLFGIFLCLILIVINNRNYSFLNFLKNLQGDSKK
jgi:hypothetical protein